MGTLDGLEELARALEKVDQSRESVEASLAGFAERSGVALRQAKSDAEGAERAADDLQSKAESLRETLEGLQLPQHEAQFDRFGDKIETVAGSLSTFWSEARERTQEMEVDFEAFMANVQGFSYQVLERLDQTKQEAGTKLDDLLYQMGQLADAGNEWAQQLIGAIQQVKEGALSAEDVMRAFGAATVEWEGQIRSLKDVLLDVLPAAGDVQAKLREMRQEIERDGVELPDMIRRLQQQHNT